MVWMVLGALLGLGLGVWLAGGISPRDDSSRPVWRPRIVPIVAFGLVLIVAAGLELGVLAALVCGEIFPREPVPTVRALVAVDGRYLSADSSAVWTEALPGEAGDFVPFPLGTYTGLPEEEDPEFRYGGEPRVEYGLVPGGLTAWTLENEHAEGIVVYLPEAEER